MFIIDRFAYDVSAPTARGLRTVGVGGAAPLRLRTVCTALPTIIVAAFTTALVASVRIADAQTSGKHTPPPGSPAPTTAPAGAADLDGLVAQALSVNPTVRAARARLVAARARISPAGLRPDPSLMLGIAEFPIVHPGFYDNFTMIMVGIGQTIPYAGKLALRSQAAEREADAADASLAAATRQVTQDVRNAFYELAFLDRALEIVARNQGVLVNFMKLTETRYSVGSTGQQDVLKAGVEATRLAETAVTLTEQRRTALARLNAALNRPSDTPLEHPDIPTFIARAAVADSASHVHFVSVALGARAADSPLPALAALQETALRESPVLREHEAMIAAQAARVALARKDHLPDIDVSVRYDERPHYPDYLTATVSIPLPLQRQRKQDALVASAGAELAALEAEHDASRNALRADVARLYSMLERDRAQLALYVTSILPQGRVSLASAMSNYQVGKIDFLTVLDNQSTLFNYETEYFRALTDFASTLSELDRVVGKEILR